MLKRSKFGVELLYSAANDPETANEARTANDLRTAIDPHNGPQMIPLNNRNGVDNRTAMTL